MEAQPSEGMPLLGVKILQSPRNLIYGRSQPVEQPQARIGERDTARRAVQQADPEMLFELPHRVAERGGRDAEARRGRAKAEIVGDGNKCGQSSEIGAAHC